MQVLESKQCKKNDKIFFRLTLLARTPTAKRGAAYKPQLAAT